MASKKKKILKNIKPRGRAGIDASCPRELLETVPTMEIYARKLYTAAGQKILDEYYGCEFDHENIDDTGDNVLFLFFDGHDDKMASPGYRFPENLTDDQADKIIEIQDEIDSLLMGYFESYDDDDDYHEEL